MDYGSVNSMRLTNKFWKGSFVAASILIAAISLGQTSPTLKGNNARTGSNADPASSSPGRGHLTWFRPNTNDTLSGTIVRNNTAANPNVVNGGFLASPATNNAAFYYDQPSYGDQAADIATGGFANYPLVFDGRLPSYHYSNTVATTSLSDPRIGSTATFTWNMDPVQAPINQAGTGNGFARNYALYVWLPAGGTGTGLSRQFPQRNFVYEIRYGTGLTQTYIEVIDTYASGPGWVRLGNAGNDSNRMFQYDGTNPIQIRLHNTVPLDPNTQLPSDNVGSSLVYADAAMAIPQVGVMNATPTISAIGPAGNEGRAIAAVNRLSIGNREGQSVTVSQGEVKSYNYNDGRTDADVRWTFRPAEQRFTVTMDNSVATNSGFTANPVGPGSASALGVDYLTAPLNDTAVTQSVTYAPTLEDGEYLIQFYLSPDTIAQQFGRAVRVEISEGGVVTSIPVDMNRGPGWFSISTQRYRHADGAQLEVAITNMGSNDDASNGRLAFADAVRFVGAFDTEVNSTPTSARVWITNTDGISRTERDVVFVCSDDGRIYCLDAAGNGDGTTDVYWAYPSIPDANNPSWTDPNIDENIDGNGGVTVAEMPIGFGRSSPIVQRIGTEDYLFIAARNGRVYCLNTAGRGDFNEAEGRPGTAVRQWSYPNDFPRPRQAGSLGTFANASLAYAENGTNRWLYVPTESGHMIALNPVGNPATRTTNVIWDFPGRSNRIAPVTTTPAIHNGRIYFGTTVNDEGVGRFYSLNAATGALNEVFEGAPTLGDPNAPQLGAFFGGPAVVPAALIGGIAPVDTVFVANNNLNVYALDANNITNVLWRTNELNTTVTGPLTFSVMNVFHSGGLGATPPTPVVVVPGESGQWSALFARPGTGPGSTNSFGGKFAWGKVSQGNIVAGTSNGAPPNNPPFTGAFPGFLYGGDTNGNLFAFSNATTLSDQGTPPIQDIIEPDNPDGAAWRNAKIKILPNLGVYESLRNDPSTVNYNTINALPDGGNPAFEWGETVYFVVYDFPYQETVSGAAAVSPALVNIQISTEGATARQFSIVARQFTAPPPAPAQRDGYAVLAFAIQGSGPNSLPPGNGRVSFSVTPGRANSNEQAPQVAQNPSSYLTFQVANPLGLRVGPSVNEEIGVTVTPTDPGALVNGTPNLSSTLGNETLLTTLFGEVGHATTGSTFVQVFDRSLMTLLRGPGRGVDQVRVSRPELEWRGGTSTIIKPVNTAIFGNFFEDLPTDLPNVSLDYPNVRAENVRVTKDPNGSVENPAYSGVFLRPPTRIGGGDFIEGDTASQRTLIATPFLFEVDVPRFQPANFGVPWNTSIPGNTVNTGYGGRVNIFVDSNNDGQLNRVSGRMEANRGFWLHGSVSIDEAIEVRTPNVDLGSLPGGAGYSPLAPGTNGSSFNPWNFPVGGILAGSTDYINMFKPFVVENPGNVNLLNLRVAKATGQGASLLSWGIFSSTVDEFGWLDARTSLWSDIDYTFARTAEVMLQKARVGDRSNSVLQTNPTMRVNGNLDTTGGRFLPAPFSDNPRIAVSLPIGFPVGTYSQVMRIIEDANRDESLALNGNVATEVFSDPTLTLTYKTRETRLTNDFTRLTAPMTDDPTVLGTGTSGFLHQNLQPTAARTSLAGTGLGNLLVAWTSNRPTDLAAQPTNASSNNQYRIFIAGLNGGNAAGAGDNENGVRDLLSQTNATSSKWFHAAAGTANGYPAPGYVYPVSAGETVVAGTEKYGAPSLPARGQVNAVAGLISNPAQFATFDMPFVGEAQKQTSSGRMSESRLFVGRVSVQSGGVPDIEATPSASPYDLYSQKGRPSAVRLGDLLSTPTPDDVTFITYSALSAGNSRIFWTLFDYAQRGNPLAAWTQPQPVDFGEGFESVTSPSVTVRPYRGTRTGVSAVYDLAFTGKLRGRKNSEVFQGRLPVNDPSNPIPYPQVTTEVMVPDTEAGQFRAKGVEWDLNQPVTLQLETTPGTFVSIQANTRRDPSTGLIVSDTTLGGKAYIDPRMGTVRLSTGLPLSTQRLVLTYTPKFIRVSTGTTAGYSGVSQFNDNRLEGLRFGTSPITKYWARSNGDGIESGDTPRVNRFFFAYNRAAAGAGQAARPFMKTMRMGIQLPYQIFTNQNGNIGGLSVTGATGYFQVDPVKGRIYFSPEDEDRQITVTFNSIDQSTGTAIGPYSVTSFVAPISEMDENPVPIEQAVNESNMFAFPDPLESVSPARPNLIWMFWSSTRGGSPDLYFQTVAPRFAPQPSRN